jgi:hypothetical protein
MNLLKRKIYDDLLAWKTRSKGATALMIDGARRVGKSFLCEYFAQSEYKSHIIIDFGNAPKDILDLFDNDSSSLDLFFAKLSAFYSKSLHQENLSSSLTRCNSSLVQGNSSNILLPTADMILLRLVLYPV